MARYAGRNSKLELIGKDDLLVDVSGDVYSIDFPVDFAELDVSGFNTAGRDRIAGLQDVVFTLRGTYNSEPDRLYDVLSYWYDNGEKEFKFYPIGGTDPYYLGNGVMTSLGFSASVDGRIELTATIAMSDGNVVTLA